MKKFCNRITKQQWRVTVPNINPGLFRRSPSKLDPDKASILEQKGGDVQEAAERAKSLPNSVLISDDDSSDSDEDFEDARAILVKSRSDVGTEMYTDIDHPDHLVESKTLKANAKYDYEVPKISFSFFGLSPSDQEGDDDDGPYETVNVRKLKSEVKIVLACPESSDVESETKSSSPIAFYSNDPFEEYKVPVRTELGVSRELFTELESVSEVFPAPPVEVANVITETKVVDLYLTKSLEELTAAIKCGSDPSLFLMGEKEEEDGGLYKVPKSMRRNRLSQSLNDFGVNDHPRLVVMSAGSSSSVEHVSCSQVLVEGKAKEVSGSQNSAGSMEYCKTRSKLPAKIRRVTLLRKPRSRAADTWTNLKTKVNNMIAERSTQFGDKEKLTSNIEEMYKSSKHRCKKVLRQTGKIFKVKREQDNSNCDTSRIVKNDAFFANIKAAGDSENAKGDVGGATNEAAAELPPTTTPVIGGEGDKKEEFDFNTIKSAFRRSRFTSTEGQNGFDDLRRYVKQGGDFSKELSTILQERSEAELQYAKSLSKLSNKLARACRDGVGGVNDAWRAVALELEARAEGHRVMGAAILEDTAKPLRTLAENQHRARKQAESVVDKAARGLADWRSAEAKTKKHSHTCARDNEKLQDAMLDNRLSRSTSLIHLAHIHKTSVDKENAKLEGKKRKAEDAVKKADIEYYTLCVRAERARLEWESAVAKGANTFQSLEEERLNNLKAILTSYLNHSSELGPRLIEATERLRGPLGEAEPSQDLSTFVTLRHSSQQISEQLLPDFYCEHITLAMNRERRKQALVKLLHLIKQDVERERKSKNGLENLSRAIKQTPNFGAEDSNQNVTEKLYHMKSMLTYLEGARYKVQSALAELDSRPRTGHPLAPHITITRDKSGLQQSILKVPQWLREQWSDPEKSPVSEKSTKSESTYPDLSDPEWNDRGTADGNSNQPDSDFDEFSSQGSSAGGGVCTDESPVQPIALCRALYPYTPNLSDELALHPGDILSVYRQQDDGWWLGECNGSVGIFPATYVETLPPGSNTTKR